MAATYGSHDPGVCAQIFAARSLAFIGRTDEALQWGDDAVELARALRHPFSIALSLTLRGALDQTCRDAGGAAAHAREGQQVASEQGFGLMRAWCTTIRGWAEAAQGADEGRARISEGIASARTSGSVQFLPYLLGLQADACLRANDIDSGLQAVDEALLLTDRSGERFYESDLHRVRGELLLLTGTRDAEATEAIRSALDGASAAGAALPALRAAVVRARWSDRLDGNGAAFTDQLRSIRAAMPAGARVPDLEEADALLAR